MICAIQHLANHALLLRGLNVMIRKAHHHSKTALQAHQSVYQNQSPVHTHANAAAHGTHSMIAPAHERHIHRTWHCTKRMAPRIFGLASLQHALPVRLRDRNERTKLYAKLVVKKMESRIGHGGRKLARIARVHGQRQ
jgi:hypothetical protein